MHFNFQQNTCAYPGTEVLEYFNRWYFKVKWTVSSKNIFSKILIFEISKILIFNTKSFNSFFSWLINHFTIKHLKRAFLNRFLMTLVTYSDSRRFFQYKILPLFFDCFPKSWWSAPKKCNCDFEFAFLSNHHWYIVCQIINDSIFSKSYLMNSRFWKFGMKM